MNPPLHLLQRHNLHAHNTAQSETVLSRLLHNKTLWVGEPDAAQSEATPTFQARSSSRKSLASIPFDLPEIDSVLPHGGLQHNSIHEILYDDPLQPKAVAHTLPAIIAHNAYTQWRVSNAHSTWSSSAHRMPLCPPILWIGKQCWPTPLSLSALEHFDRGANSTLLQNSLCIDPPDEATTLWAIETALRSRAVRLVIAACPRISRTTTQKFALAARTHGTTAILLRSHHDHSLPSCATSRWLLRPTPSTHYTPTWELQLLKLKGGTPQNASWILGIHDPLPSVISSDTEHSRPLFAQRHATTVDTEVLTPPQHTAAAP